MSYDLALGLHRQAAAHAAAEEPGLPIEVAHGAEPIDAAGHAPVRPRWECAECAAPWPCPPARARLCGHWAGSNVSSALCLVHCLVLACQDLTTVAAGELYQRFLGWGRETQPDMPTPASR